MSVETITNSTKSNASAEVTWAISDWVFEIRNLVTQDTGKVHLSHLEFHAESDLNFTGNLLKVIAHNSEGHVMSEYKLTEFTNRHCTEQMESVVKRGRNVRACL